MNRVYFVIICLLHISIYNAQISDGYTDKQSYYCGENIKFFINGNNTNGSSSTLFIKSFTDVTVATISNINLQYQDFSQGGNNTKPWQDGYKYSETFQWTVPCSLKSGLYYLTAGSSGERVPIIIKGIEENIYDIVVEIPTNTINAYNISGGKSLYGDISGSGCEDSRGVKLHRGTTLSFLRPQNFELGMMSGIAKWFYNSSYNVKFVADIDLESYTEFSNSKLIIITGHSEYWSRKARQNFDLFISQGKNGAVFSGNSLWWQIDYLDENGGVDLTKLTCYKSDKLESVSCNPSGIWLYDQNCDLLYKTIEWSTPSLKYSILGSLGTNWVHGGYGYQSAIRWGNFCNNGFKGYKVINSSSPIFTGTNLSNGDIIQLATHEYDGTIVKRNVNNAAILNSNGYPVLDNSALGFYRAEMAAYDLPVYNDFTVLNIPEFYAPIIIFQKKSNSGITVHITSTNWCDNNGIGGDPIDATPCSTNLFYPSPHISTITDNIIQILTSQNPTNIFTSPTLNYHDLLPNMNGNNYSFCQTNGYVELNPSSFISGNDYYSIEQNNGYTEVFSQDCSSCNRTTKSSTASFSNNVSQDEGCCIIYPNPTSDVIAVVEDGLVLNKIAVDIYDVSGRLVKSISRNNFEQKSINVSDLNDGIYLVHIVRNNEVKKAKFVVIK